MTEFAVKRENQPAEAPKEVVSRETRDCVSQTRDVSANSASRDADISSSKAEGEMKTPKEAESPVKEEPKAEAPVAESTEEEVSEEEDTKLKLPFPTAAVVRVMKANMDSEKMIRKDVKLAMNKWLGEMCARVSREMNKFPYVMMHLNELNEGKRIYEDMEAFDKEKQRILAHFDAMKKDIERLERDLGKKEEEVITMEEKE